MENVYDTSAYIELENKCLGQNFETKNGIMKEAFNYNRNRRPC